MMHQYLERSHSKWLSNFQVYRIAPRCLILEVTLGKAHVNSECTEIHEKEEKIGNNFSLGWISGQRI